MSKSKLALVGGLLAAIILGRQLLPGIEDSDDQQFVPVARFIEDEALETSWVPDPTVRDPFLPLVLPEPPIAPDAGLEDE